MLALESVTQRYSPTRDTQELLETFRQMVNDSITIGLAQDACSLKRLSTLAYRKLSRYRCYSRYKLCAISRAAGILAARKKSLRRGYPTKSPYTIRPQLTSCYGFKIWDGLLKIPVGRKKYCSIPLTKRTREIASNPLLTVRSITLTLRNMALTVSKRIEEIRCTKTAGVDRNLRNLTFGNEERVIQFDLSKTVRIAETTTQIIASFRRQDARIRHKLASKFGARRRNRVNHIIHCVTKRIVKEAFERKEAIVVEDLRGIRRLYKKGNGQGTRFRGRLNGWPYAEAQRQIEYKARWEGVPIMRLSKLETRGTTFECPRCGERLQLGQSRQLRCFECRVSMDRDVVAAINLSRRGRLRFDRSEGESIEALNGNPTTMVILRVDGSKLGCSGATWRNQSFQPNCIRVELTSTVHC